MPYVSFNEKLFKNYIGIKVKGISYYLWFKTTEIKREDGRFSGVNGWGNSGACTSIECDITQIISIVYSEELHYS